MARAILLLLYLDSAVPSACAAKLPEALQVAVVKAALAESNTADCEDLYLGLEDADPCPGAIAVASRQRRLRLVSELRAKDPESAGRWGASSLLSPSECLLSLERVQPVGHQGFDLWRVWHRLQGVRPYARGCVERWRLAGGKWERDFSGGSDCYNAS
jgi:hypothetical protein